MSVVGDFETYRKPDLDVRYGAILPFVILGRWGRRWSEADNRLEACRLAFQPRGAPMYRVTLACENVPAGAGGEAASDIQKEFAAHRPHHKNVSCTFTDGELVLTAENDFDPDGLALMDEFSDCISAYIAEPFDGGIRFVGSTLI